MKNILVSEYYKMLNSPAIIISLVLPCIVSLLIFSSNIDIAKDTFISNIKYSNEQNKLLSFYSNFFAFYNLFFGIFIVIVVLIVFYIDRGAKNIFSLFVSYQNIFQILMSKFLFLNSLFIIMQIFVFLVSILFCFCFSFLRTDFGITFNISSLLLVFMVFLKIFLVNIGTISLIWLTALVTKNFMITVPSSLITGTLLEVRFLPFSNSIDFWGSFILNRKLVFKDNPSASLYNSFELNSIDLNSLSWLIVVILFFWYISLRYKSYIIKINS